MKQPIFTKFTLQEIIITIIGFGIGIGLSFAELENSKFLYSIGLGTLISIYLSMLIRNPLIPEIFKSLLNGGNKIDDISKKTSDLISDHKFTKVNNHINQCNEIIKDVGLKIFYNYMDRFKLVNGGINVAGEQFSLNSYAVFWDHLGQEQLRRKNSSVKSIIARVTHSNDVSLWEPNAGSQSYTQPKLLLRNSQRIFIENGGIIVRIFIGADEKPNEAYQKTMTEMEKIGIEVKYISEKVFTMPTYDFLYLHDENIVLKWFSAPSKILAAFEIQDNVEKEVLDTWKSLYFILKDNDDEIKTIPEGREF